MQRTLKVSDRAFLLLAKKKIKFLNNDLLIDVLSLSPETETASKSLHNINISLCLTPQ